MARLDGTKNVSPVITHKSGYAYVQAYLTSSSGTAPIIGGGTTPRPESGWLFPRGYRP